jgi:hypothetical protein
MYVQAVVKLPKDFGPNLWRMFNLKGVLISTESEKLNALANDAAPYILASLGMFLEEDNLSPPKQRTNPRKGLHASQQEDEDEPEEHEGSSQANTEGSAEGSSQANAEGSAQQKT